MSDVRNPQQFFHVTPLENAESIKKEGLQPMTIPGRWEAEDRGIHLTANESEAKDWAKQISLARVANDEVSEQDTHNFALLSVESQGVLGAKHRKTDIGAKEVFTPHQIAPRYITHKSTFDAWENE